jgi:hypothetical protein
MCFYTKNSLDEKDEVVELAVINARGEIRTFDEAGINNARQGRC